MIVCADMVRYGMSEIRTYDVAKMEDKRFFQYFDELWIFRASTTWSAVREIFAKVENVLILTYDRRAQIFQVRYE
jgi:hypothetical protein